MRWMHRVAILLCVGWGYAAGITDVCEGGSKHATRTLAEAMRREGMLVTVEGKTIVYKSNTEIGRLALFAEVFCLQEGGYVDMYLRFPAEFITMIVKDEELDEQFKRLQSLNLRRSVLYLEGGAVPFYAYKKRDALLIETWFDFGRDFPFHQFLQFIKAFISVDTVAWGLGLLASGL